MGQVLHRQSPGIIPYSLNFAPDSASGGALPIPITKEPGKA